METGNKTPVTFTGNAVSEIRRLMAAGTPGGKFLRVGVKGGGCSGMTYVLDFDEKTEKDVYFEIEGIPCVMNPAHTIFVADMQVDYGSGLDARGFTFTNPNASTTCGCGSSFGV